MSSLLVEYSTKFQYLTIWFKFNSTYQVDFPRQTMCPSLWWHCGKQKWKTLSKKTTRAGKKVASSAAAPVTTLLFFHSDTRAFFSTQITISDYLLCMRPNPASLAGASSWVSKVLSSSSIVSGSSLFPVGTIGALLRLTLTAGLCGVQL